jgi:hypothetical protein
MAWGALGAAAYGSVTDRKARTADAATDTLRLASVMAVVITSRRLLVFKVGGGAR